MVASGTESMDYLSLVLIPAAFLATAALTLGVRQHALNRELLDVPNERSSHSVPMPHGGGIAIVVVTMASVGVLWLGELAGGWVLAAYVAGGLLVAEVGYLDDHKHVWPPWRLLAHFTAGTGVLVALGNFPPLSVFGFELDLGLFTFALSALFIVWLVNLYNFMDGIDGIAGVEAVTVAGAAAGLLWYEGAADVAMLAAVLAAANLGFLIWNWPPAKIFMGDVGSGFLGFCFGALALMTFGISAINVWVWPILLGAFLVDATVTLVRRVLRRETFYEAHRSHAYQYASRKLGSHLPVTVAVGMINVCWLLPIAFLVVADRLDGLLGLLIAYVPLVLLVLHFKAGAEEMQDV